jgi:colanic acid biosynthesis glycosyl transferase WcaI
VRVLILTIYHDPEPIPKTGDLARELLARGHDVTVVTAFPHYPDGNLYPGYRLRPWSWETRDGVRILRTFIYPYHGTRASVRIVNYVSWMLSGMAAAWLAPRCDVIYVWHPPLTVGVTAWVLSRLKRVPFVYDVQDLWPESALASGLLKPGRLVRLLNGLARWVYARADRVLVVSAATAAYLRQRGVDPGKIRIGRHWVDDSVFDTKGSSRDVRADLGLERRFVVMFAGNLGLVQGLDTVIDAAAHLREAPVTFVFVGDGADRARLQERVAALGLSNVLFAGRHPAGDMPDFFRAADALLVHLRPSDIAEHAVPTKILSYLAAGRPIICAVPGAAAELVRAADAGPVVPPGDAVALAGAVTRVAGLPPASRDLLGTNGRRYLRAHFDRARVIGEYELILREAAALRTRPGSASRSTPDTGAVEAGAAPPNVPSTRE